MSPAEERALEWHSGRIKSPPTDMAGKAFLARHLPNRYIIRGGDLVCCRSIHLLDFPNVQPRFTKIVRRLWLARRLTRIREGFLAKYIATRCSLQRKKPKARHKRHKRQNRQRQGRQRQRQQRVDVVPQTKIWEREASEINMSRLVQYCFFS